MFARQATLDDTGKIVDLFTAGVPLWQRLDARGRVQDLPYAALTIYERWLHGGAWMCLETGAIWLSHLLSGNGFAYVVEAGGRLLAYAEAFLNREPSPLGAHLHLAEIRVAAAAGADETHYCLAAAIRDDARAVGRLSVSYPDYDKALAAYYQKHFGVNEVLRLRRYTLAAQLGQSFYKSKPFENTEASLIEGWTMVLGRWGSPRAFWEREWVEHWRAIPEILSRAKQRQYISAAGQEALVCFYQQLYSARNADVYCWSPRALSLPLLAAIRDLGHRLGFRALALALPAAASKLLPAGTNGEPNQQIIAAANV